MPEEVIRSAINTNPAFAGISLADLDRLADQVISYETNKSAAISFAAGLPGGFAMFGTIPADVTQYYVHAFRIVQKLAYLYGWRELLSAKEDVDDETIGVIAIFFGVMLDVENAAMSLASFASSTVMNTVKKQVTKQLLVKTSWYRAVKKTLRSIGVNLTKKAFNQGFSKVLPVIGGVVSSGLTFMSLQSQSSRLKNTCESFRLPVSTAKCGSKYLSRQTLLNTNRVSWRLPMQHSKGELGLLQLVW